MTLDQRQTPLFDKLKQFSQQRPMSFHVPGHKNGHVFPKDARKYFSEILPIDLTELTNLDDLHAPHGVIKEAERLAKQYFNTMHTYFLIGGSTVGNLAMILATCLEGETVIVQRNSHKSIMNGLEMAKANPVFIAPSYDKYMYRYTHPRIETLKQAIKDHPETKVLILTYPDYFGHTYVLKEMIQLAHAHEIIVLIDEAHGVHFSLGEPFPPSALELGADIVVQSAHKMAPAMTMASFLHVNSSRVSKNRLSHYLQMLQSSSPSYPLLASLDIARYFLANLTSEDIEKTLQSVNEIRSMLESLPYCEVLPIIKGDDPTKLTLHVEGISGYEIAKLFEQAGIYPELATHNQVLFIHGLHPFNRLDDLKKSLNRLKLQLKSHSNHDTIDVTNLFPSNVQSLALSYQMMNTLQVNNVSFKQAIGYVAAEAIIPYPPGIPLILKGETITEEHITIMEQLIKQGANFQQRKRPTTMNVFTDVKEKK